METIPDLRAYFVNDRGERALAFGVMGTDGAVLDEQARKIQSEMTATGKFRAVSSNAALDRPEVIIEPDLDRLAELGISTATLSETLRIATIGDIDANLAKFTVGDRQIPIRVQLDEAARDDISVVVRAAGADAFGRHGAAVVGRQDPLRPGPVLDRPLQPRAPRRHQRRHGAGRRAQPGLETVWQLPAVKNMPAGTRIQETGDAEVMGEVFAGFATAMSHRPDAGAGGADPAVRLGVPLLHHPGLAAACGRRRRRRRCG